MAHLKMATVVNPVATVKSVSSWISNKRAEEVLYWTQLLYPILLFFLFVILFAAHGIITASTDAIPSRPLTVTGPGGKPLPNTPPPREKRPKKPVFNDMKRLVFQYFAAGQIITFFGNTTIIGLHALVQYSAKGWWCGEATVVSI
jgi:ATP-binding cassette, subfamily B, vacuolar membrane transporter HMT1/ACLQ